MALVTSDCHQGLRDAIASVLPGASWQRCRTHYHRNLLTRVPKSAQPWVSTLVRTIFEQPDAASVRARHAQFDHEGTLAPVSAEWCLSTICHSRPVHRSGAP